MPKLISRLSLPQLRNEAHVELHADFLNILGGNNVSQMGLTAVATPYSQLVTEEKKILDFVHKSLLTPEIEALDAKRDDLYRGLVEIVKANTHSGDPAKKEAAVKIKTIIDYYGDVSRRRLFDETTAIADLVDEISNNTANAELVTKIGAMTWCADLLAANTAFRTAFLARNDEIGERPGTKKMNEIRG